MDAPTFSIWIQPEQFPGVEAINLTRASITPEIKVVAAKYLVQEQGEFQPAVLEALMLERIASRPVVFGGEI